jgi:pyrrolidone-carboxylate peptidase
LLAAVYLVEKVLVTYFTLLNSFCYFAPMNITQLSPIAAGLTGGITVTLTGTGFQTGAAVFFGSRSATQVTVVSSTSAQAILPAASETGSVNVQIVNPNGTMASLPDGFTYVNTNQGGQAEVLDIHPLSVLEDTPTQISIRGYNLIAARDQGLFALRGPSQANITASGFTDSIDPSTGIETLTGTIQVTSNPPLEPLDRMAIQVLASRRPGALTDGVAETSRKMFTVFPQAVPVPLAYTAIVSPDGPTLVVIAGRNLEGCTLDLGKQFDVHLQRSDDKLVVGIVSLEDPTVALHVALICAIRAYHRRNDLSGADAAVPIFEWPSRGLSTLTGTPGGRLAIVTGFDPFGLPGAVNQSNPSGLIALKFKNQILSSNQGPVEIATAIFPVRYADFDARIIELSLGSLINSVVMIVTCSDNASRRVYDIERYATRTRGGFADNLNKHSTTPQGTGPDNFLESTLPYERVITSAMTTRELPGPDDPKMSFVLDQSYQLASSNGVPTVHIFVEPPADNTAIPQCYQKDPELPNNEPMRSGSGGSYLSNEIFYRVASLRSATRPALPTGHFHVVSTDTMPLTSGPKLLNGAMIALQKLMQNSTQLRSSGDITFPPTVVNATSQPITLTVTNDGDDVALIATSQITPPFEVQLPGSLPLVISPAETVSLSCTFKPNTVRSFTGNLRLSNTSGDLLLTVALTGQGIAGPNTPKVTSFSPTSGHVGDTVSIAGEHFDGATGVEIGGGTVSFTVVSATQIDAVVSAQAATGLIKVTTPNGIAFSQTPFTILAGGNNASFVTQTPPPTTMTALQSVAVSVKMHNNGTTVWRAGIHKLGSQNPANNTDWGLNRVPLLADVMPGGNATFNFNVTAPVVPRDYNFQWQMHSGSEFFGAASTNVGVTVNAAFGSAPQVPSGLTATVASANQIDLHWNDVADEVGYVIERKSSAETWTQIDLMGSNATSMSDQNLSQGSYVYRIRAFNSSGYSAYSNTTSATIGAASPPVAPVDLTTTAGPGLQIMLGWTDKSHDEEGFRIERKTASTAYTQLATVGPDVQSFTDTGVAASTTYIYRVKAYKAGLDSTPTNEASATTPGPQPPAAPSNLAATVQSIMQVDLSWVDNSNNEDGFNIERRTESGPFVLIQTVAANVTTFADFTVWGGTTYTYRIKAFNASGGESDGSNEQQATTPTSTNPPSTPTNMAATTVSSTQVNLTWSATGENQAGFKIERKTGSGDFAEITDTPPSAVSFSDTGLQMGTTYTYRVKAFNDAGESGYSNEASATTTALQTGCQVSLVSGDGVYGYAEGASSAARWRTPLSGVIAIDPVSNQPALFIADSENHRIRMILLAGANAGQSILIAGDGTAGLSDAGGNPLAARYNGPRGIAAFTNVGGVVTSLIIADTNNHAIRKLLWDAGWKPSTISSTTGPGLVDSTTPSQCKYNAPEGIVVAPDGFAYVADTGNGVIRKVDQNGVATTRVAKGVMKTPTGITVRDTTGELYISDVSANKIWKIIGNSAIWIAGSGEADFANETGTAAKFNAPSQLAWASTGAGEFIYIADRGNNRIRKLAVATNAVTTLAGSGTVGYGEGACATAAFNAPRGVAAGPGGDVYVLDSGNNRIRKVR